MTKKLVSFDDETNQLPAAVNAVLAASYAPYANPDDIGFDIVLVIGQSNAVGYGPTKDLVYLDPPHPRIWQYGASGGYAGTVIQAMDPLSHNGAASSDRVGHAMNFARDYVKTVPDTRSVLLVPAARGSTGFTPQDNYSWDPDYTAGTNLYTAAVNQAKAAVALSSTNRVAAILWCQGETDAGMSSSAYATKLGQLIDGVRAAVPTASAAPFIIQQLVPEAIATRAGFSTINAVHIDMQRTKERVGFTYGPTGMFNTDDVTDPLIPIHYNGAGQRALGSRIFAALQIARANVIGTPPVAPLAVSLVRSGTSVAVSWKRSKGRVTDYKVEYRQNGGSWSTLARTQSVDASASITGLTATATVDVRVSSINEQGTSAPSSVASSAPPGQVTGLTGGTPGRGNQPLTWTAAVGATSYRVEYKKTADSTWLTGPLVTSAAATVTALDFNTGYDYRVYGINGEGSGAVSSTTSATTAPMEYLTDVVSTAMFSAHSLRVVRSAYSGPLIRVRRSSDNTELDIAATSTKVLDTAALLAFAGAGSAYLTKFYDQSGNARDYVQATTAKQPQIVASGALITKNGRPAVRFGASGTSIMTGTFSGLTAAGAMSSLSLYTNPQSSQSTTMCLTSESNTAADTRVLIEAFGSGGVLPLYQLVNSAGTAAISLFGASAAKDSSLHQWSRTDSGTAAAIRREGVESAAPTNYTRSGTLTMNRSQIGALLQNVSAESLPYTGDVLEVVTYAALINSTERGNAEANQKNYAVIA